MVEEELINKNKRKNEFFDVAPRKLCKLRVAKNEPRLCSA